MDRLKISDYKDNIQVPIVILGIYGNSLKEVNSTQAVKQRHENIYKNRGHSDRDRMVDKFTTTYAISAYHHSSCEFKSCLRQSVLDATLCDKVFKWCAQISGFLLLLLFTPPLKWDANPPLFDISVSNGNKDINQW